MYADFARLGGWVVDRDFLRALNSTASEIAKFTGKTCFIV